MKKLGKGTSLVAKNLSANAGTWVQPLVQEDPTYHRATKQERYKYWSLHALEPVLCKKRSRRNKPTQREEGWSQLTTTREAQSSNEEPVYCKEHPAKP